MGVTQISQQTTQLPMGSKGPMPSNSSFNAAMLEAILRGTPKPIQSTAPTGGTKQIYRPADVAAMAQPGRDWIGATRKSDVDVDQAVAALGDVAGPDGKLSLEDVQAYLLNCDPNGMTASDIAVGWNKLTSGSGEPLDLDQVKSAVSDVVGHGSAKLLTGDEEDPDALKDALSAFKKEAAKTVAERAKDQILKKHNLTEAQYEALPPDQKLQIDHEIADRVQLLMRTEGKRDSKHEQDQEAAAQAARAAEATADSTERQRSAASSVSTQSTGFLHPLTKEWLSDPEHWKGWHIDEDGQKIIGSGPPGCLPTPQSGATTC